MGRYRLVEQIGEGSMGAVFFGEYGALRRPVAIKILHDHLVGDASTRRLLAEARTLSLVDHPGIVKVFDVGIDRGRAFIVMERLIGESLWTRIARQRLGEDRVVLFARQLASALQAAHAAGIVHRDLKPENVLIVPDPDVPGGERVKIIDFGIAKRRRADELQERTATGVVLGTPSYMAPEQWERAVDPRADIYSLGIVIYVMATGELPFSGTTGELLAEHAYCAPPRAADRGAVSSWLSSIIDRCLAKRPVDRFPSMAALAQALRALEHAIAAPTGPTPRFDDDDSDDEEETTRPGPRALALGTNTDALTTVTVRRARKSQRLATEKLRPRAVWRALSRSLSQLPRARSRLLQALSRRPRWQLALGIVALVLLVAVPIAAASLAG